MSVSDYLLYTGDAANPQQAENSCCCRIIFFIRLRGHHVFVAAGIPLDCLHTLHSSVVWPTTQLIYGQAIKTIIALNFRGVNYLWTQAKLSNQPSVVLLNLGLI